MPPGGRLPVLHRNAACNGEYSWTAGTVHKFIPFISAIRREDSVSGATNARYFLKLSPNDAIAQGLALARSLFGRITQRDERLRLPIREAASSVVTHKLRHKKRSAHPASAQSMRMRSQEQILSGHCHALDCHNTFRRLSFGIRIDCPCRPCSCRAGSAPPLESCVGCWPQCVCSISAATDAPSRLSGLQPSAALIFASQALLGRRISHDTESPRLPVVCRRRPTCACQQTAPAANGSISPPA